MATKSDEHVFQSRWVEAGVYILIYPYMCELMIGYRLQNVQCWGEPGPLKHIQKGKQNIINTLMFPLLFEMKLNQSCTVN